MVVNLGKWILRWLFGDLVEEEIKRDTQYREKAIADAEELRATRRANAPPTIEIPGPRTPGAPSPMDLSSATSRPANGIHATPTTPGLNIGLATPGPATFNVVGSPVAGTEDEGNHPRQSQDLPRPSSSDKSHDYFSTTPNRQHIEADKPPSSTTEDHAPPAVPQSPAEPEKEEKKKGSLFGKKFRMEFPKKLGRNSTDVKTPVLEEKLEESDKSSEKEEKVFESNLSGVVDRIRHDYETFLETHPGKTLATGITPSGEDETPAVNIPAHTSILIQQESGDTAVAADLYQGSVGRVREEVDKLEKAIPHWLGEVLLKVSLLQLQQNSFDTNERQNRIPAKEVVKVAFVLKPYDDLLPPVVKPDG